MLKDFWKAFKSGTDIRGVAVEGAGYDVNLTNETVEAITNGFILWLAEKKDKSPEELIVSVGRDSRISGPAIAAVVKQTLLNAGVYVINCDLASTPAISYPFTLEPNESFPYSFFTHFKSTIFPSVNTKYIMEFASNAKSPSFASI